VNPGINLTISLGLSDDLSSGNYEKLLSVADERLYRAKNEGRNRVVC
jgi:PleD family two-component response regulator